MSPGPTIPQNIESAFKRVIRRTSFVVRLLSAVITIFVLVSCGGGGTNPPLQPANTVPAVSLSPPSLTFVAQPVGTISVPQTVTLTNTGNGPLVVTAISTNTEFPQTNPCITTLSAGAQCTISVTFSPQATGTKTSNLSVSDNAPGSPQSIPLSGTGVVNNPVPTITNLSPTSSTAGAAAQTLTINGTNFLSTSTVTYNGVVHTPTFVSSTQLTITLSVSDQATAGNYPVVVTNPAPGGGASGSVNFTVTANNPVPGITSLSPTSATAGAAAQTLTINGANFLSTSTVTYNGVPHTPTFVSSTQLTITLSASEQATAGTYPVVVTNPAPGGGASGSVSFTVTANNPVPGISSLSPTSATAGAAAQTLAVNGTNFLSTSTVTYSGVAHTPSFVSSTQLTINLSTSDQATAGTYAVVVTNPAPGGGASGSVNFTVNLGPTISSISVSCNPNTVQISQTSQCSATVTGTGSYSSSVTWSVNSVVGGSTGLGTISASGLYTAPASTDPSNTGSVTVAATSISDATKSGSVVVTITEASTITPTIQTIAPTSVTVGSPDTQLAVFGTSLISSSVVNFDGTALPTTYVSSTEVIGTVPAGSESIAGTHSVTISNPSPGGISPSQATFTIENLVPELDFVAPNSIQTGSSDTQVLVHGTAFLPSSTVSIESTVVSTVFLSSSQLTVTVPGGLLTDPATLSLT